MTITIACTEDKLALLHGAELHTLGGELDHDEPPDGEREGQKDGDRVDEVAEVHVELHEVAPALGILQPNICRQQLFMIR